MTPKRKKQKKMTTMIRNWPREMLITTKKRHTDTKCSKGDSRTQKSKNCKLKDIKLPQHSVK